MRLAAAVLVTVVFCLTGDEAPKGVPAKPTAADYAAKAEWKQATFAASLVPAKQVEHLFAFDISKTFVVFEVACYAGDNNPLKISREAFVVKVNASGDAIHHSEAPTVAASIQRQREPEIPSSMPVNVSGGAEIGVQHGTDPYTGRPVTGVYTGGQVGVQTADNRPIQRPDPTPRPGATYEDRKMLEAQLTARSLPEGSVDHAVAGYLFFRKSDLKAQPDNTYTLEYLADEDGSGATHAVTLAVPKKTH
jgi:hypothetical protein